jgi:hypothetical protein
MKILKGDEDVLSISTIHWSYLYLVDLLMDLIKAWLLHGKLESNMQIKYMND